jgi:antitoxin CptB
MNDTIGRAVTGMGRTSDGLDARRKRMMFRAWHRGTKELDILLGSFADKHLGAMNDEELTPLKSCSKCPSRTYTTGSPGARRCRTITKAR